MTPQAKLRALKKSRGLTNEVMAQRMGRSRTTIQRLLSFSFAQLVQEIRQLCDVLECDVWELFEGIDEFGSPLTPAQARVVHTVRSVMALPGAAEVTD